jgi:tRNA(Ile)-lysidine synthase
MPGPEHAFVIPGQVRAPEYGVCLLAESAATTAGTLRPWKPGDRVTLRYSRGPRKVAEVLDRLHIAGAERKNWPVVESDGKIVWMRGAEVEAPGFRFTAQPLSE